MADVAAPPASPNSTLPTVVPQKDPNLGGGSFGTVPVMDYGMTFREVGTSGLRAFGGYVREEFLPQLQGRQAQTVYREMADNSPIIGGMIFSINATMRKVDWRVVPADDSGPAQEAADFVDSVREDMSHTWDDFISEGLSMIPFGFAPMEIVYKRRLGRTPGADPQRPGKKLPKSKYQDGLIGWRRMPVRGQDTVIKWFFDENGEVLGLTQQPYVGPLLDIPIEKLLLFRPSQHKGNPEGRSALRNSYRPYYMVKRIEEQEAILYERLNGIPVLRVPSSLMDAARAGDAQATAALNMFKQIAVNMRIDEQMGIVLPSDTYDGPTGPSTVAQYSLELVSPGGGKGSGSSGSDVTIQRHQTNMLMSVMADFLSLGHGARGTQALAVSKTDMFFQAVEGYLNSMASTVNEHGLERLWALNGMDYDLMPQIEPDLAQRIDLDVLSNFILRLAQSGMALFPNEDLESALMDAAGLPDIADTDAQSALGGHVPDLADKGNPVAIVGPNAAMLMPAPTPAPGSPQEQFQKMLMGSMARRIIRKQGGSIYTHRHSAISSRQAQLRKHRLPTLGQHLASLVATGTDG